MNWPSGFCGLGVFSGLKSHTIILGAYHIKDGAHDGFPPGTSFSTRLVLPDASVDGL